MSRNKKKREKNNIVNHFIVACYIPHKIKTRSSLLRNVFKNAFSLPSPLLVLFLLENSASEILVRRQFNGKKKEEEKEIVNVDGQEKLNTNESRFRGSDSCILCINKFYTRVFLYLARSRESETDRR